MVTNVNNGGWREAMRVCGKGICRNTVLHAQFCCDPKGDLKHKVHFKKRKKETSYSVAITPIPTSYQTLSNH